MVPKHDLQDWIVESLRRRGGEAHHIQVARDVWERHEDELRRSGDLFYTWQYELRWAAKKLRDRGVLVPDDQTRRGVWSLSQL